MNASNEGTAEVVTMGEVMALLCAPPNTGLEETASLQVSLAGAEATVAIGLARLGHHVGYVGCVGDDPLGHRLVREIRGEGVDVRALRVVSDRPTGILVRDATTDRPISVQYYRAGSAGSGVTPEDLPRAAIRRARVLHVTGITAALSRTAREALETAVEIARSAGTIVCFDPNVRLKLADATAWREIVESFASRADIVLTGADDARVVTDGDPADWFHACGAQIVVVKDGTRGARESDGSRSVHQPIRPTRTIDPVGAGDAFAAGWLSGWLRGQDPEVRLREASIVASLAVARSTDVAGLPTRDTVDSVLHAAGDVQR